MGFWRVQMLRMVFLGSIIMFSFITPCLQIKNILRTKNVEGFSINITAFFIILNVALILLNLFIIYLFFKYKSQNGA